MTVLLFPGQGTQRVGMGMALRRAFEKETEAVFAATQAQDADLLALMRRGPAEMLARTEHAQVAVTAVNLAALAVLRDRGITPSSVAGHSVGLIAALVAADVLDVASALHLAARRGALMGALPPGSGMVSVRGLSVQDAQRVADEVALRTGRLLSIGLVNGPDNVVLSGDLVAVHAVEGAVRDFGATAVRLAVSHAFHSPFMDPAASAWAEVVRTVPLATPVVPVVSDLTGRPTTDVGALRRLLADQLTATVRWDLVMARLTDGEDRAGIEVSDSRTLRSFARAYPALEVESMVDTQLLSRLRRREVRV